MRAAEWKKRILIKQHLVNAMTLYAGLLLAMELFMIVSFSVSGLDGLCCTHHVFETTFGYVMVLLSLT